MGRSTVGTVGGSLALGVGAALVGFAPWAPWWFQLQGKLADGDILQLVYWIPAHIMPAVATFVIGGGVAGILARRLKGLPPWGIFVGLAVTQVIGLSVVMGKANDAMPPEMPFDWVLFLLGLGFAAAIAVAVGVSILIGVAPPAGILLGTGLMIVLVPEWIFGWRGDESLPFANDGQSPLYWIVGAAIGVLIAIIGVGSVGRVFAGVAVVVALYMVPVVGAVATLVFLQSIGITSSEQLQDVFGPALTKIFAYGSGGPALLAIAIAALILVLRAGRNRAKASVAEPAN